MQDDDIIHLFKQGKSKEYIIQLIWNEEKRKKYKALKKESQKVIETILLKEYMNTRAKTPETLR